MLITTYFRIGNFVFKLATDFHEAKSCQESPVLCGRGREYEQMAFVSFKVRQSWRTGSVKRGIGTDVIKWIGLIHACTTFGRRRRMGQMEREIGSTMIWSSGKNIPLLGSTRRRWFLHRLMKQVSEGRNTRRVLWAYRWKRCRTGGHPSLRDKNWTRDGRSIDTQGTEARNREYDTSENIAEDHIAVDLLMYLLVLLLDAFCGPLAAECFMKRL